ncbi:hypothetical protein EBR78_11440 [bacterium]|nr:hypothetical protein [bacterium]
MFQNPSNSCALALAQKLRGNHSRNLFIWLGNANHLDFTDSTGGDAQGRESSARADVQKVVRPATLMFFNKCLKNDNSPSALMTTESLKPYVRGEINSIEVLSK